MVEQGAQSGTVRAYDAWNAAIVTVVFGGTSRGRPVYLDVEDDLIAAVAAEADLPGAGRDELLAAVREWLGPVRPGRNVFSSALVRTREWVQAGRLGTPPFVALLTAFVLAAEDMHADQDFSSSNYYVRLAQVLGVSTPDKGHLQRDFMDESPTFWRELNTWLEAAEGARGLPTAYAFDSRRYVSVPISQALVRSADREKLIEFFLEVDLRPGTPMAVDDMVRRLGEWLPTSSASRSLKAMWESGREACERIAGVAVVALAAWDGSLPRDGKDAGPRSTRVYVAVAEKRFPRYGLQFAALLRAAAAPVGPYALQEGASAAAKELMVSCGGSVTARTAGLGDWLLLGEGAACIGSLLAGELALVHVESGLRVSRTVKRLVVLQRDDAAGLFIEVEHAQLGRSCLLLVHDSLWAGQEAEITRVLREGYVLHPSGSVAGLQGHWTLVSDTAVVDLVDQDLDERVLFDLASLIPVSWTQLALNGGLMLPGRDLWHVAAPPEMLADSLAESEFVVTVEQEDGPNGAQVAEIFGPFEQAGVVHLADVALPEGDYVVEIRASEKKRDPLTRTRLRLRSSDSERPAVRRDGDWVGYALDGGQGPSVLLGASRRETPPEGASLRGALLAGMGDDPGAAQDGALPPAFPRVERGRWPESLDESEPTTWASSESAVSTCLLGGHHFQFPDVGPGAPRHRGRWEATCKNCGRHLVVDRRRKSRVSRLKAHGGKRPRLIVPRSEPRDVAARVLLDALCFLGECTWSTFEGLCRQVDEAPYFAWELARRLSALGHVDVVLGADGLPDSVVAAPAAVVRAAPGEALLIGRFSRRLLHELDEAAAVVGGAVRRADDELGLPLRRLVCGQAAELEEACAMVDLDREALCDGRGTALRLLAAAPRMAALGDGLEERRLPRRDLRRFDFTTNRWRPCDDDDLPGAYCARSFTNIYGLRTPDSQPGCFTIADAATVKYLAALDAGAAMLWYARDEEELVCRLGAPLPPLIERAVVLATGRLPSKYADGTVRYRGVDEELASAVWRRVAREEDEG